MSKAGLSEQQELALKIIYEIDYDIGKECDPDVFSEDTELIDNVAFFLNDLFEYKYKYEGLLK